MRTLISVILGTLIAGSMIAAPIAYKRWHDREYRNFHVVEEGVLYRSGQLPVARLQQLVALHGIRTVISLRDSDRPIDKDEEAWIKARHLNFVRLAPLSWWPDADGNIPGDANVKVFREVMDDPAKYPVLIHCFAGIHRTGTMCAIFRMDYQGWTNDEAMNEMRTIGYTMLDDHADVLNYLTQYRSPQREKLLPILPVGHKKNPVP